MFRTRINAPLASFPAISLFPPISPRPRSRFESTNTNSTDLVNSEPAGWLVNRPDCKQVVIALVVTPEGFPLGYETLAGNTLDKQTLMGCIETIQSRYGKADRIWIMDRGIPTEDHLREIRETYPHIKYLVGTPKARVKETRPIWESMSWIKIRETVEVKSFPSSDELYVVAKSDGRRLKEMAIRRKKLAQLLRSLRKMRRETSRDRLLMRMGAARAAAASAKSFVTIEAPPVDEAITRVPKVGLILPCAGAGVAITSRGHAPRQPQARPSASWPTI